MKSSKPQAPGVCTFLWLFAILSFLGGAGLILVGVSDGAAFVIAGMASVLSGVLLIATSSILEHLARIATASEATSAKLSRPQTPVAAGGGFQ